MRKAIKLYMYLTEKNKDKLFSERHMMIGIDLAQLSDEEFNNIVNS